MSLLDKPWIRKGSIFAAAAALFIINLAFKRVRTRVQGKLPENWVRVGTVSGLTIYPIKSFQGIPVTQATVTRLGLKAGDLLRDRAFMVINKLGRCRTQMMYPKLAVIGFRSLGTRVTLSAPGVSDVSFDLPTDSPKNRRSCRIHEDDKGLEGLDCGDAVASWLQTFIGVNGLRLVHHSKEETQRSLSKYLRKFPSMSADDLGTFQNDASYHLLGEESITELNKHVERPASQKNFRPNILVSGTPEPGAEIKFGLVRIGDRTVFKASKPCERCKVTTVDQDTGVQDPDGEPLKTLRRLRPKFADEGLEKLFKNQGIFGLHMGLSHLSPEGTVIRVGDPVYAALL